MNKAINLSTGKEFEGSKYFCVGIIKPQIHDARTLSPENRRFNENLRRAYRNGQINRDELCKRIIRGKLIYEAEFKNVISLDGFSAVSKFLAGDNSDAGGIDTALFGTGTGTTSESDTALFNEIYRNAQASRGSSGNVTLLTAFIDEGETTGNYTEFGNCINGGLPNEKLWSHISGFLWTVDLLSTLTVSQSYTLLNQ